MKKLFNFKIQFLIVILLVLSVNSCKDEANVTINPSSNYTNWEQVDQSDFMYEQLKYKIANYTPQSILPDNMSEEFTAEYEKLHSELEGYEFSEMLKILQDRNLLSEPIARSLNETKQLLDELFSSTSFPDFALITQGLENRMKLLETDHTLTIEERKMAITHVSLIKGVCQYYNEIYPPSYALNYENNQSSVEFRSCTVAERLECIVFGTVTGFGIGTVVGGMVGGVPGMVVGATVGAVAGFFTGIISSVCCEPDLECYAVEGITLSFSDCSPSAQYVVWGFGPDDLTLDWFNVGGTPATITTPTSDPRATISQNSTSTPVITTFVSNCTDGATNESIEFERNLADIVTSVNGVFLMGADQVNNQGFSYTYSLLGVGNGNFTTQWSVSGGTILSSTLSSATIQWNDGIEQASIGALVTNNCPNGQSEYFNLNITGGGPE